MTNPPLPSSSAYPPYTLANLQSLIDQSPAYAQLPPPEQSKIQEYIKLNNKPILIYIYQKLLEESAALEISRDNLAKKILNLDSVDQASIQAKLSDL